MSRSQSSAAFMSVGVVAVGIAALASLTGCATPKCAPSTPEVMVAPPVPAAAPAASAPPSAPSTEDMTKVAATLDRFHAAAATADEEGYFALFADGGVFLGTDAKERWTVPQFRAYSHPRFASGKAWSFRSIYREIAVRGDTAWFDELLDTPNLGPARGSGVLVRDANVGWKIAQYNLSVPIPNERFAEVKKIIGDASAAAPPSPSSNAAGRADPPVCAMARAARARNSPAANQLDAQCRAASGRP